MSGRTDPRVYLGLGGNLGKPDVNMAAALRQIDTHDAVRVTAVSPLFRTPPWGKLDQPDFLNACAEIRTSLPPRALLELCLGIERGLKRVRNERWGPRAIDIDILLYDELAVSEEGLQIPHPQLTERAFVLVPLEKLTPGLRIEGKPIATLLRHLSLTGIDQVTPDGAWWRSAQSTD